ncbi:hypothetical protein B0H11DRAFT_2051561 [Mycena galericulata]|nr:hypothetical protein B0H11DRAFT_2051561 [Mycena galericulata]
MTFQTSTRQKKDVEPKWRSPTPSFLSEAESTSSRPGSFTEESFFTGVCSRSGLHKSELAQRRRSLKALFKTRVLGKFKKQRNAGLDPERTLVDVDPTSTHETLCSASSLDFDDPLAKFSLDVPVPVGRMDNQEIHTARKNSFIARLKCGLKHVVIRLASRAKHLSKSIFVILAKPVILLWEIVKLLAKITLGITKYCLIGALSAITVAGLCVTGVCLLVFNLVEAVVSILPLPNAISNAVKCGLDLVLVLIAAPWLLTFEIVSWMLS